LESGISDQCRRAALIGDSSESRSAAL